MPWIFLKESAGCAQWRQGGRGTVHLLMLLLLGIVLCINAVADTPVHYPEKISILSPANLRVKAELWDCDTGAFAGTLQLKNELSEDAEVTVQITGGHAYSVSSSKIYSKFVRIPAGKSITVPVVMPGKCDYGLLSLSQKGVKDNVEIFHISLNSGSDIRYMSPQNLQELPSDPRMYCHVTALSLSGEEWEKLPKPIKSAITEWVELGGQLNITAGDVSSVTKEFPPMRFSEAVTPGSYGFGKITAQDPLSGSSQPVLNNNGNISPSWPVRKFSPMLFIPAIIIFTIIVGPGSMLWVKKSRHPMLLLVFIPAISLVTCVALFAVYFLDDGIRPKICRQSLSFLDQSTGKVLHEQTLGIESPIGISKALEFSEDTLILPPEEGEYQSVVEAGTTKLYNLAQPGIPVFLVTCRSQRRREKLEVLRQDGQIKVVNGLGTGISGLQLRDEHGDYWFSHDTIAPGQEKILVRRVATAGTGQEFAAFPWGRTNGTRRMQGKLASGCYQASLNDNVFGEPGIRGNRIVGDNYHFLVGRYAQ